VRVLPQEHRGEQLAAARHEALEAGEAHVEVELLGAKSESMLPDNYLGRSFGGASINKDEDSTRDPKVALASNVVIAIVVSALAFGGLFPDQVASLWGLSPK